MTEFFIGRKATKGTPNDADTWLQIEGFGPTPGERKTWALTAAVDRLNAPLRAQAAVLANEGWTRIPLAFLESQPTISEGQADDLKIELGAMRVWLSRCTVDDGEPCNNKVTIEKCEKGRWIELCYYEAK